ncbi:hypothetical protein SUDANB106_05678 [Streptomyces sp. enrichment culture]
MRARSATMAGVTRVILLIVGGLTACTAAPDSGSLPGSGEAAQRSPQQPPSAAAPPPTPTLPAEVANASPHPYVGMWVTADGHIRQELLANGRYDEARGDRESACTGPHQVSGTRIEYVDETARSEAAWSSRTSNRRPVVRRVRRSGAISGTPPWDRRSRQPRT